MELNEAVAAAKGVLTEIAQGDMVIDRRLSVLESLVQELANVQAERGWVTDARTRRLDELERVEVAPKPSLPPAARIAARPDSRFIYLDGVDKSFAWGLASENDARIVAANINAAFDQARTLAQAEGYSEGYSDAGDAQ